MQAVMSPHDGAISHTVITRILRLMEERNLSQSDVVSRANQLGSSLGKATFNRILHGRANSRYQTLDAIARALGTDVRALTAESDAPSAIPEPDRWAGVLFVPVAHYYGGYFHLDPAGARIPTSDLPAGSRYVTLVLNYDTGMAPEIMAEDRVFIDVTPDRVGAGDVVVVQDHPSGNPENRMRMGRATRIGSRVHALDNTGGSVSVPANEVLGVVRRVCRENLVRQNVTHIVDAPSRRRQS